MHPEPLLSIDYAIFNSQLTVNSQNVKVKLKFKVKNLQIEEIKINIIRKMHLIKTNISRHLSSVMM